MPNANSSVSAERGGGGGSGFALGPAPNEFTTVALRDAQYAADAAWAALYNGDRANWVRVAGADIYRRNVAGTAWEAVTAAIAGPAGARGPAGVADDNAIDARIAPYARIAPSGTMADAQIPAAIARDAEIATAISNLRGGVAAAYDTLDELADALIASGSESAGIITLAQQGGGSIAVDATSLMTSGGMTETQINALIQAALEAAVEGTENGLSVVYDNGVYNFDITSGGGLTLATVLAAVLGGTDIGVDRATDNQITINYTGGSAPAAIDLRAGWSPDTDFTADEFTATSANDQVTIPDSAVNAYLGFWLIATLTPTEVHLGNSGLNSFPQMVGPEDLEVGGSAGRYWRFATIQDHNLSGDPIRVVI